jgi:hypothetical protein
MMKKGGTAQELFVTVDRNKRSDVQEKVITLMK